MKEKWKMKKIFSLVLITTMIAALMSGCKASGNNAAGKSAATAGKTSEAGTSGDDAGSYINIESQWPVVNEPVTLKITLLRSVADSKGEPKDRWFWKWISEKSGIDFEFNLIDQNARDEKVNLMFASDDLTDVMIMLDITNDEMAKYAGQEQMLMPLNDLIDQYAPDIKSWFDEHPEVKASSTYADGNIYALPMDSSPEYAQYYYTLRCWVNEEWLDALGLEVPQTLDDFYDTMVAFRDNDPNGNNIQDEIPISFWPGDLNRYVYTAMGVMLGGGLDSPNDQSYRPAIWNGEAIIPANHPDLYLNYLTFMNKLYSEKLMDPDTYTLTETQVQAKAAENTVGVHFSAAPHTLLATGYEKWTSLAPLTSQWNDTKMWPVSANIYPGNFAISASCKYPEAAIRLANWLFTPQAAMYCYYGPPKDSEDLLEGHEGWWFEGDQGPKYNLPEPYQTNVDYMINELALFTSTHPGLAAPSWGIQEIMGISPAEGSPGASQHWRNAMNSQNIKDYYSEVFPNVVYDIETNERLMELKVPISDYIKNMEAKFITGSEPLSNFDSFMSQLKSIGIDEMERIYKDAYASYKNAMS